jgi:serine/threonine protein kinase
MTVGDFRIEARLGAGGMGVVYQARQVTLNRVVALKVLGTALRTEAGIARFRREAQAIAKLHHPSIAAVHFIGQDDEVCYIAMEFVEGISLREVMNRLRTTTVEADAPHEAIWATQPQHCTSGVIRFDVDTQEAVVEPAPRRAEDALSPAVRTLIRQRGYLCWCVKLVRDAALALAHAHKQGVIHRDVKPDNLLHDPSGKVTVIDFGLARFYDDETVTYTGQLVGTPMYMSPEQIIGRHEVDGRTDVYSLGMVLHELLTLAPPVTAANRESLLFQIVTRALPPITWNNSAIPADLSAIVHCALAKDPADRYASMEAFADDLDRFTAGKPVAAPPYRYRLDETEILARRPMTILYVAFLCIAASIVAAVLFLSTLYSVLSEEFAGAGPWRLTHRWVPIPLGGAAVFFALLGRDLLIGRRWAWWGGMGLGGLSLWAAATLVITTGAKNDLGLWWNSVIAWSSILAAAGFGVVAGLARPRVRAWFRFAAETRSALRHR